jgi:magnesium transporter
MDESTPPTSSGSPSGPVDPSGPARRPTTNSLRIAIRQGRTAEAVEALRQLPPVQRAELFVQLRTPEQKAVLGAATPELAAAILADSDSGRLVDALTSTDLATLAPAFGLIPPDNLADIVLRLPKPHSDRLLELVDAGLRAEVLRLTEFDPETAGGMMSPRYLSVPDVVTVGKALELLRSGPQPDSPSYVYVVDAGGKLVGVAPLRHLLLANARSPVSSTKIGDVTKVRAGARREEIVDVFNQHHYVALPVVDDKDRLVGIVTFDDVMAAMRQREREVLRGMTGVDPREAIKETFAATRGRIPWVMVTILGGLGCAVVGGLFQKTLSELVVLAIFVPIVTALGESIGAQTISVVLSTLAGGTLTPAELTRFALKEFLVGLLVGLFSGLVVSLASLFWHGNPRLGLLIGGAVFVSVAWTAILAVFIPGIMKRLKVNPAIASGPLVLSLSDFSTLFVYFGGAALFSNALK